MNTAPILLFVYNRPLHTLMTLGALAQNDLADESDLIIYSDAAKRPEHQQKVDEVRQIIHHVKGFRSVQVIEQSVNRGLSISIVEGVTEQVNKSGKAIVLEDDLLTSPAFLTFMNKALVQYELNDEVISIHGYSYPVTISHSESYFLHGADCWGWATWKRGWELYQEDGKKLLEELKASGRMKEFDYRGFYSYSKMLEKQIEGINDSWAVRWYASAFLLNKLTLYPSVSLVQNTGLDASGTHSKSDRQYIHQTLGWKVPELSNNIAHDQMAYDSICRFFESNLHPLKRITNLIRS